MPFRTPILILASCAIPAGCNVNDQGHFTTTGPDKAVPTDATAQSNPAEIQLLTGTPERAYTQLGPIKVTVNKLTAFHPNPSVEAVEEAMRKEAAALGADAIIQVDFRHPYRYAQLGRAHRQRHRRQILSHKKAPPQPGRRCSFQGLGRAQETSNTSGLTCLNMPVSHSLSITGAGTAAST